MNVYLVCHGVSFDSLLLIILSLKIPNSVEKHIQELMILLCHVTYFSIICQSNTAQVIHVNHVKVSECV